MSDETQKNSKVETVLQENMALKEEIKSMLALLQENDAKQKGFRLIEDAFLVAESLEDIDEKALKYMEDIFGVTKAALYINSDALEIEFFPKKYDRVFYAEEKIFKYAYVEKRPYFGTYTKGLISEFTPVDEVGSYIIAPIIEDGRIVASLNLYSVNPNRIPDDGDPAFIKDMIFKVGITLKKLHNLHILKKQVNLDTLTGIYNKSMIFPLLEKRIAKYKKEDKPFTFLLMDLDNFKKLNVQNGYLAGDEALKILAASLMKSLKDDESVGRFGADIFYMIIDESQHHNVAKRFSEISLIVAGIADKYQMRWGFDIRGGYACVPYDIDIEDLKPLDIARMADIGLYQSKIIGKRLCGPSAR